MTVTVTDSLTRFDEQRNALIDAHALIHLVSEGEGTGTGTALPPHQSAITLSLASLHIAEAVLVRAIRPQGTAFVL